MMHFRTVLGPQLPVKNAARTLASLGFACLTTSIAIIVFSRLLTVLISALFFVGALYLFTNAFRIWRASGAISEPRFTTATVENDVIEIEVS